MDGQQKFSAFYADLDTIFDTRLALLYEFGESYVSSALEAGYLYRIMDKFPGIDFDTFKERYAKRDKRLLKNAMRTRILDMLVEFGKETNRASMLTPFQEVPKLIINTYPYKLTEQEENLIVEALVHLTDEKTDISVIHLPVDALTPNYIKSLDITMMAMYNYVDWLETMAKNEVFLTQSCPDVGMVSPAILFKEPSQQEESSISTGKVDPFKSMVEHVECFVKLSLLSIDNFSIAL